MSEPAYSLHTKATGIVQAYSDQVSELCETLAPTVPVTGNPFSVETLDISAAYAKIEEGFGKSSRLSEPDVIFQSSDDQNWSVETYSLQALIPLDDQADIQAKDAGRDIVSENSEFLVSQCWRVRLKDLLKIYETEANYGTVVTQTSSEKFSNASFNAYKYMLEQLDKPLVPITDINFHNSERWTEFRTNPYVIEAIRGTGAGAQSSGGVTQQEVAQALGVQRVNVVPARERTGKRKVTDTNGTTIDLARMGGNFVSLTHINPAARTRNQVPSFAMFGEFRPFQVFTQFEGMPGHDGVTRVKVSGRGRYVVKAKHSGLLIKLAV